MGKYLDIIIKDLATFMFTICIVTFVVGLLIAQAVVLFLGLIGFIISLAYYLTVKVRVEKEVKN